MPDAVVIGGGPAGAAAAITLARGGLSVAVIERSAFPRRKVCGEFLTATNIGLLHRLGVGMAWERAAGPGIRRVALFCGPETVMAPLPGRAAFGRSLGRETLDSLLLDAACAAGVEVLQPCRATAILPEADGKVVHLSGAEGERILSEGIGMALQSGSFLAEELLRAGDLSPRSRARAGRRYTAASLRALAPRVLAAAAFAQLSLSDPGRALAAAAIGRMPALLSGGAMLSGKRLSWPATRRKRVSYRADLVVNR